MSLKFYNPIVKLKSKALLKHLVLVFLCIIMLFPIVWMISASFKTQNELYSTGLALIPRYPTSANYTNVFSNWPVNTWIINSLIVMLGSTSGRMVSSVLAGFGFGYFKFKGRDFLFFFVLWSMSIPFMTTMIPNYITVSRMGLLNTLGAVIVPHLGYAFGIFFLRQHIKSIPDSLFDAAYMDGANSWQILIKIVIPLIKGAMVALVVLLAIESWNMYFWPLLVLTKESVHTLTIGLTYFQDVELGTFWGELMAAATITSVPMFIIYAFARTQLIEASITSGVK